MVAVVALWTVVWIELKMIQKPLELITIINVIGSDICAVEGVPPILAIPPIPATSDAADAALYQIVVILVVVHVLLVMPAWKHVL